MAEPPVTREEFVEAMATLVASSRLAIQLLVITLERSEAIDEGDYAATLMEYLDSPDAESQGQAGITALLEDLLHGVVPDDWNRDDG